METTPKPRNISLDIVLTLLLCGLWNLVVQYKQIQALNHLLKARTFSFGRVILFSFLTLGLYFIYHQYKKAKNIADLLKMDDTTDTVLAVVLTLFGLPWVYDALAQDKINDLLRVEGLPEGAKQTL